MTEIAVKSTNVDYFFGKGESRNQVLFDNNLEIARGEIVIMTGPSGSGKTTLLTLIGTLRSIQTGSIQFLGQELRGLSPKAKNQVRRDIGFIFQHHNLFDALTAFDTMRVSMQLRAEAVGKQQARQEATELLGRLGLGERMGYKPSRLSGGQKQRVAIARALINRPNLVLADEPTAALDQESGQAVIELLKELAAGGSTILIVTHDNRILNSADRIVNMMDGHIHSNVLVKEHMRLCEILSDTKVFERTRAAVLSSLVHHLVPSTLAKDEVLFRQGDSGDRFYLVDKGEVQVIIDGKEVSRVGTGGVFGEMALLLDQPRNATIIATQDTRFLSLDKQEFLKAVEDAPTLAEELRVLYMQG